MHLRAKQVDLTWYVPLKQELYDAELPAGVHLREGLGLMDVQGGSTYPALLQRLGQSFLIHQASPRGVDQERTLTHLQEEQNRSIRGGAE